MKLRTLSALLGAASLTLISTLSGPGTAVPAAASQAGTRQTDTDYGRMMLLLDSSGSMAEDAGGTPKIDAAKQAITDVVNDLPDPAYVGLRVFGAKVFKASDPGACTDTQVLVPPGTDNRDQLIRSAQSTRAYGETPIPAALRAAADDLGTEGTRSIVLVSDGESTCDPDPCLVAEQITKRGIDLQINVVGFDVSGKARQQLQCIAENGNGSYHDVDSAEGLANTMTMVSERATQAFGTTGQEVTGTPDRESAPLLTPGMYHDTIPAGVNDAGPVTDPDKKVDRFYRIKRSIPNSTLWVGVAAQAPHEGITSLNADLWTTDMAHSCGTGAVEPSIDDSSLALASVGSYSEYDHVSEECAPADELLLNLTNTRNQGKAFDADTQIVVIEEPPASDADSLPEMAEVGEGRWQDFAMGQPSKLDGGTTFADAPELDEATYESAIVTGESRIYKVPVGWGQRLQVQASSPSLGMDEMAETGLVQMRVDIVSPTLGSASQGLADHADGECCITDDGTLTYGEDLKIQAITAPVRFRNRECCTDADATALPGYYYAVVSLTDLQGELGQAEVPYQINAQVLGNAGEGAPDYGDADIVTTSAGVEDESGEDSRSQETDAGATDESNTGESSGQGGSPETGAEDADATGGGLIDNTMLAAAGTGVLGIAALAGALLLWRRRS